MNGAQAATRHPGASQARRAVADGADLVLVCVGGDGTVVAVAGGLAYSHVPLGILSSGTKNLLCRNLGIPTEIDRAIDVALVSRSTEPGRGCTSRGVIVSDSSKGAKMRRTSIDRGRAGVTVFVVGVICDPSCRGSRAQEATQ
ncbi:diacylglycerol/lipid kinase family protein [Mycolicibacterium gadium]|uniref:diacylglycerol/lipid kinase family protein n=1 Tax=Mycolicibacterium gadium TaxID=1794 RepID=UPI003A5C0182